MRTFSFLLLIFFSHTGQASNALLDFSNSMYSFTADFTQTVYADDSEVIQENKGQVQLMRPGRFRWTYNEPFKQLIVADGLSLWVYDEDIAQVTVRPQNQTLGSAPIGLLSGERALQSEFTVTYLGDRDNLQWFQLDPIINDTDFQRVFIAVDDNGLRAMELRDSFDQATQIRFSNFRKNVDIRNDVFVFVPPAGADVVGEVGVAEEVGDQQAVPTQGVPDLERSSQITEQSLSADRRRDDELLGISDSINQPAEEASVTARPSEAPKLPATAADVLQDSGQAGLVETPDDKPGTRDAGTAESAVESEVFFEVIETIKVPVE